MLQDCCSKNDAVWKWLASLDISQHQGVPTVCGLNTPRIIVDSLPPAACPSVASDSTSSAACSQWNFAGKYLIDKHGVPHTYINNGTFPPQDLQPIINELLAAA